MSLRPPLAAPTLAIAAEFQGRFVRDAHILVAEGYSRLAPATLAKKSEDDVQVLERMLQRALDRKKRP